MSDEGKRIKMTDEQAKEIAECVTDLMYNDDGETMPMLFYDRVCEERDAALEREGKLAEALEAVNDTGFGHRYNDVVHDMVIIAREALSANQKAKGEA